MARVSGRAVARARAMDNVSDRGVARARTLARAMQSYNAHDAIKKV